MLSKKVGKVYSGRNFEEQPKVGNVYTAINQALTGYLIVGAETGRSQKPYRKAAKDAKESFFKEPPV
jgi:hypothetical protein